jgi:hypothetical protein
MMKSITAGFGPPRPTASSVASLSASANFVPRVSESAGSRMASCSTVHRCARITGL